MHYSHMHMHVSDSLRRESGREQQQHQTEFCSCGYWVLSWERKQMALLSTLRCRAFNRNEALLQATYIYICTYKKAFSYSFLLLALFLLLLWSIYLSVLFTSFWVLFESLKRLRLKSEISERESVRFWVKRNGDSWKEVRDCENAVSSASIATESYDLSYFHC